MAGDEPHDMHADAAYDRNVEMTRDFDTWNDASRDALLRSPSGGIQVFDPGSVFEICDLIGAAGTRQCFTKIRKFSASAA